jgi:hypothetical protein
LNIKPSMRSNDLRKNIQLWDKDENFLSPDKWGFTYLQVVPAFSGAKQVITSDIIKCTFIPFPGLEIKNDNPTCLCFRYIDKGVFLVNESFHL